MSPVTTVVAICINNVVRVYELDGIIEKKSSKRKRTAKQSEVIDEESSWSWFLIINDSICVIFPL